MLKIKVADLIMHYEPYNTEFFEKRFADYLTAEGTPDLVGIHKVRRKIALKELTETEESEHTLSGTLQNGNHCVYTMLENGTVFSSFEYSKNFDYSCTEILSVIPNPRSPLTNLDREYLRAGNIFKDRLIMCGGTVLHGSAISYRGEGVIFSAPSGTGKSTHTALWKDLFKDDVTYINDDKPAIRFSGDVPYCHGTPFSGKTDLNNNIKAPLKAIVFLKRGTQNKIYEISNAQAVCYLNDQTCPSFYETVLFDKNLDCIERLLKTVKIYLFECNPTPGAAIFAKEKIFR